MSNSKTRLGRGLGGLISGASSSKPNAKGKTVSKTADAVGAVEAVNKTPAKKQVVRAKAGAVSATTPNAPGYREIELTSIVANPYQPRREIHPEHVE
jgi:hypothetical protein